ncbi:MAG: MFS transporter [candidate division NC10 bacterium]|nr:MFS transporter [candidate division NC10 bacterium]
MSQEPKGWQAYHTVWAVLIFAWITNYLVRMGLSPVLVPIMREFQLTYAQAGLLATAFFYAYTFMQLPAGVLGDWIGKKTILVLAPLWWGLMSLGTGLAPTFSLLFLARFLTGVGQGTYFGNDRPVIAAYTPADKMGFGQGVSFTGLGMGMAIGISLAGVIADWWGWRMVFVIFTIPSLVAGAVVWRFIQEPPRTRGVRLPGWMWLLLVPFPLALLGGLATDRPLLLWSSLLSPAAFVLCLVRQQPEVRKADLWFTYLAGIAPIYCLWVVGIWAPAMFLEIGVRELSRSSLLASLLGVSAIPGLLLMGSASDRLARRGKGRKGLAALILLGMAGSMLLMGTAVSLKASPILLACLVFAAGFCIWGVFAPIFALLAEITPTPIQGTSFGLNNTINFIGSLVAPIATGWIKDASGSFAGACYLAAAVGVAGAILVFLVHPAFRWGREVAAPAA